MKTSFYLILLLLVAVCANGQRKALFTPDNTKKIKSGIVLNNLENEFYKIKQSHFIQRNKNPQQNYWLKSSPDSKVGVDSLIIKFKEEGSENLKPLYKEEFVYDGWGHLTLSILYWRSENGSLEAEEKCEYNYDSEGNMIQKSGFNLSESGSEWESDAKVEFTYDAAGNNIKWTEYGWEEYAKDWFAYHKEEFSYDASGNMTQSVEYYNDGEWNPQYKIENSYNENGVLLQSIKSRTEGSIYNWIPIRKLEYTLDEKENIIQSQYFNWDEDAENWYQGWMEEYTCDEQGNIIQNLQAEWEGEQKAYFGKFEYNFDNSLTFSDLLIPVFDDEFSIIEALDINVLFKHKLDNFVAYFKESEQSEWIPYYRGDYYYSEHNTSSVNEIEDEASKIYPNPFSNYITFSIPGNYSELTFELFDLQGRKLLTRRVRHNQNVDLEELNKGIYIFTLSNAEEKIEEGKLVKE